VIKRIAPLLILAVMACQSGDGSRSGNPSTRVAERARVTNLLVGKVWLRAEPTSAPGTMRIFLANGTLVMDSCWETYRLVSWRSVSESVLEWKEDASVIEARVASVSDAELSLQLKLQSETVEERYRRALVPYTCPDLPR
jgi:hypothetical protein